MALPSSPETGSQSITSPEVKSTLRVVQPKQIGQVLEALETIDALAMRVSEQNGEDASRDLGGSGAGGGGARGQGGASPRDAAIANIPAELIIKRELEQHIRKEIKQLEAEAKRTTRLSKAGGAHQLNEIYGNIRRLNALLIQILEASYDVLKRLFIRVFIDKQSIS